MGSFTIKSTGKCFPLQGTVHSFATRSFVKEGSNDSFIEPWFNGQELPYQWMQNVCRMFMWSATALDGDQSPVVIDSTNRSQSLSLWQSFQQQGNTGGWCTLTWTHSTRQKLEWEQKTSMEYVIFILEGRANTGFWWVELLLLMKLWSSCFNEKMSWEPLLWTIPLMHLLLLFSPFMLFFADWSDDVCCFLNVVAAPV